MASPRSTERITLEIWNGSDEALAIGWLDEQGSLRDYGWIPPLGVWTSESFRCHAFRVTVPGHEHPLVVRAEPDAPRHLITEAGQAVHVHRTDALAALLRARDARYDEQDMAGFTVYVHKGLSVPADTLELLRSRLSDLPALLGTSRVTMLQQRVPMFLDRPHPHHEGAARYHPPAGAPEDDRADTPPKEDAVEISDLIVATGSLRKEQPLMLAHEYAHAYHHHADSDLRAAITAQYVAAVRSGDYDRVRRSDGAMGRAYALRTEHEYFAEISEAYLGTNDWFPFTREQLLAHDPDGHALARQAWGEPNYRVPVKAAACDGPASSPGDEKTSLRVENAGSAPVSIHWIDRGGSPRLQAELAAGASTIIETWTGHVFEVHEAGACTARYTASARPGRATVE